MIQLFFVKVQLPFKDPMHWCSTPWPRSCEVCGNVGLYTKMASEDYTVWALVFYLQISVSLFMDNLLLLWLNQYIFLEQQH